MVKISGVTSGAVPMDQPLRTASPASEPAAEASQTPTTTPVLAGEMVSLSSRADDATALMKGVAAADQPQEDAEVQRLTQAVADGTYHPPASKVASAMLSFERLVARKLGRD